MTIDNDPKGADRVNEEVPGAGDLHATPDIPDAKNEAQSIRDEVAASAKNAAEVSAEEGESWLNKEKEAAFDRIIGEMEEKLEAGMTHAEYLKSIIGGFGQVYLPYKRQFEATITTEEEQHIQIRDVTGKSASEVAGKKIIRPMFIVDDPIVYQKIAGVFGMASNESHGMTIPGKALGTLDWRQVNLVISLNNERTIGHELRHMIDPNVDVRKGYNRILEELFAYYYAHAVQGNGNWNALASKVGAMSYYERYSKGVSSKHQLDLKEWKALVAAAVRKARDLSKKYGHLKVQRMIVKTTSINEFLALE